MLHRCCVPNAHNKTIYHRNPPESCSAPQKKATSNIDVAFTKSGDFKCQSNTANPTLPVFRCGDHEDLMNGMFKTFSMTDLRDRSSNHKGIVAQPYSCHTKNMINKVCKHPLTIPVYSPLQELCFVRTAISSSPRMERSMRGCLRREDFRLHTDCKHHDQTVLTISSHKPFSMLFGRIERH